MTKIYITYGSGGRKTIKVYGGYDIKEELKELGFKWDGSTWWCHSDFDYSREPLDSITEDDYWDDKYPKTATCKWAITPEYEGAEAIEEKWEHYKKMYTLVQKYLQK